MAHATSSHATTIKQIAPSTAWLSRSLGSCMPLGSGYAQRHYSLCAKIVGADSAHTHHIESFATKPLPATRHSTAFPTDCAPTYSAVERGRCYTAATSRKGRHAPPGCNSYRSNLGCRSRSRTSAPIHLPRRSSGHSRFQPITADQSGAWCAPPGQFRGGLDRPRGLSVVLLPNEKYLCVLGILTCSRAAWVASMVNETCRSGRITPASI